MKNRFLNSILGRLVLWMMVLVVVLLVIRGVTIMAEIKAEILSHVKSSLHARVQIIKGMLREKNGLIELPESDILSGDYVVPRSGRYFKVVVDESDIRKSDSLAGEDFRILQAEILSQNETLGETVYLSTGPDREPVMILRHDFRMLDRNVTIYAADSLRESFALIRRFKGFFLVSIPLTLLAVAIAGWGIARLSLRPLIDLAGQIRNITHETLGKRIDVQSQAIEIKGLAESFNAMLNRLQTAFDMEKRLVADSSHELKTPLTVIASECDVLLQKPRTVEAYREAVSRIRKTVADMNRVIERMLSLARLDSGILTATEFKNLSLTECVHKAVRLVRVLAESRHVSVQEERLDEVFLVGDDHALVEALLMILENAIQYNHPGGWVRVSLHRTPQEAAIRIADNGLGISEEARHRVFDRFYRGPATRDIPGAGLGLNIALAIVRAHGGRVDLESRPGQGSRFTVLLPV